MRKFFHKYFLKVYKNRYQFEFVFRLGRWKASDYVEEIKDRIYLIPTICFYFNSSEVFLMFQWLNIETFVRVIDYKREKKYE